VDSNASLLRITAKNEHDPSALATVLYVLHGRVEYIPGSIAFKNLLDIAIICDYYECAASMRPWDTVWMDPHKSLTSKPGYESWLFIAWVFRDQNIFGEMTAIFSKRGVMVDSAFGVLVEGEVKRLDSHLPRRIIGMIKSNRMKVIY
jgi:hypothetical protein